MNERLYNLIKHPIGVPILIGIASFGGGFGLGYIFGSRRRLDVHDIPGQLELSFSSQELAKINRAHNESVIVDAPVEPEPVVVEDVPELPEKVVVGEDFVHNKIKETMTVNPEPEVEGNGIVFAQDDDWDYDEELKHRSSSEPYILHKDEFYADELGYTQITLSYYAGDDIMSDEDDTPVYNYKNVVGTLKFGHGSGDPNVFYVRNDRRRTEYEVLYNPGLYSDEVLGLDISQNDRANDLKHSGPPKFSLE